jgi:glutathione synthase/RimK-type ligase-like ATP-grasp enzyme
VTGPSGGTRSSVVLVTAALFADGEIGGDLVAALDRVDVDARWEVWDDEAVDWAADLVAVRSAWDYHRRCPEFLTWARRVERISPMLNGADVFAWSSDKAYLIELAELVPVVPTRLMDESTLADGLAAGVEEFGAIVVKPRIGASGIGLVVVEEPLDPRLQGLVAGPWVVQPLVESVRTKGETSVYVFAGRAVSQVHKQPGGREIRVHELYGGSSRSVRLGRRTTALAEKAVRAAGQLLDADIAYARVDLMTWKGALTVSELELIEPGLYLDVDPANADRFAALVASYLGSSASGRTHRPGTAPFLL